MGQLVLEEDETIEVSQADMSSAFYLFKLPPQWTKYLCFNARFTGDAVGLPASETFRSGLQSFAHGLVELGRPYANGFAGARAKAGLLDRRGAAEANSSPPVVCDTLLRSGSEHFWQVYLDNFMAERL